MATTLFSNANSAVRRDVWAEHRFPERLLMSEDQHWARRVLLRACEIAYVPQAEVLHSHSYGLASDVPTVLRQRRHRGRHVPRGRPDGGRHAPGQRRHLRQAGIVHLARSHDMRWLPYTVAHDFSKYLGLQLGKRHHRLPSSVVRRCSAFPAHWVASSGEAVADRYSRPSPMQSTVEPLEGNKVKLSIEVDEQEFEKAVNAAFVRIAREVRIPGFRPGKAPRRVLEARIGTAAARQEAMREALPEYYVRR